MIPRRRQAGGASRRGAVRGASVAVLLGIVACRAVPMGPIADGRQEALQGLEATIERTAFGIPHITAPDLRGLGAGVGYAQAQDAVCILAEQIVKVRAERARYFGRGAGDANVDSDLLHLALGLRQRANAAYEQLSRSHRELLEGFAAGFNGYLARTPRHGLPPPCTGAAWVRPIEAVDLLAHHLDVSGLDTVAPLSAYLAHAAPPSGEKDWAPAGRAALPARAPDGLGSNAWAIGRDRSASGRGMLLANPHFPWDGALRFHEVHLKVPGVLDVYGASLLGVPAVVIGFNRHLAWTHTFTASSHLTIYRLELAKDDPSSYVYQGKPRRLTRTEYTIDVLEPDGQIRQTKRTFWRSHYGPMLGGPAVPWTRRIAYSLRDANEGNVRFLEQWLKMDAARTLEELVEIDRSVHATPFVNTLAVDTRGMTRFVDASRVPRLGAATLDAYQRSLAADDDTKLLRERGFILLDGSSARDEWVSAPGGPDGLVPVDEAPTLWRTDFVMNANDTATFTNPAAPLTSLPLAYTTLGSPGGKLGARSRMNLRLLTEGMAAGSEASAGRFTLERLEEAILSNRAWVAEELRAAVVERCRASAAVSVDGVLVDLGEACRALAAWDGRLDLASSGAVVWRELLARFDARDLRDRGLLYAEPFDPAKPSETPRGLARAPTTEPDPVLVKLGEAVRVLAKAGLRPDARLGDVQFARRGERLVPIHGGLGDLEGVANAVGYRALDEASPPPARRAAVLSVRTGLTSDGYPINSGSSFLLALEYAERGPRARAVLAHSQSADPSSPNAVDQTELFSRKVLRPVLYESADIEADPQRTVIRLYL